MINPSQCNHDDSMPGANPFAMQEEGTVVEISTMAENTYRLRVKAPGIAGKITPGQFFMIRPSEGYDPLLGRPLALFDVYEEDGRKVGFDFGIVVVGKLTSLMANWAAGTKVELWGPLGNGFPLPECKHLMMIAGGIGQTPFLAVSREALGLCSYGNGERNLKTKPEKMTLCYGARNKKYLAGLDLFKIDGLDVEVATDDGSEGHHGFVTGLLEKSIIKGNKPDVVYCCGPEPMMKAVAKICLDENIPCLLSLETTMACGFGACFSCVTKVKEDDGGWDYRRTCVEGPVFEAEKLIL